MIVAGSSPVSYCKVSGFENVRAFWQDFGFDNFSNVSLITVVIPFAVTNSHEIS